MDRPPPAPATGFPAGPAARWAPLVLVVSCAVVYLCASRRAAGEFGFPLDDAWIHARMALNLADGRGLAFNPGQPSAAATAPLWTLLLALPAAAGIPFPWASYLAGVASTALLAGLAAALVGRETAAPRTGLLAGVLIGGTAPFPWAAVSGMEPPLAAALVLAILLAGPARRPGTCLMLASLAALVRPELLLLPTLIFMDALLKGRGAGARRRAALGLAVLAASGSPFIAHRVLSGSWIPGAFAAKVGRHGILAALAEGRPDRIVPVVVSNLPPYAASFVEALARDNLALLLLAPVGLVRLTRGDRGSHVPWMLLLLQPCAMAILAPFGGPAFHEQRYVAQLVAIVVIAGCIGLTGIPLWHRPGAARVAAGVTLLAISAAGAWRGMERHAIEVADITGMQVAVGRWIAARPGGPGLVATNDIGAIGFFTRAPVLDVTGLATPEALPYLRRAPAPGERNRGWNGANETALLEFLAARKPRYVALFPSWYPSPAIRQALGEPVFRVDLEDNLICGDRTMQVFRPAWPP